MGLPRASYQGQNSSVNIMLSDVTATSPVAASLGDPRELMERLIGMRASAFWAGRLQLALSDILEDIVCAMKSILLWMAAPATGMSRLHAKPLIQVPAPDTSGPELRVGVNATQ